MEQSGRNLREIKCVVSLGTRARTQNGHIRNDTRDVSRRRKGGGKEGVGGSSPPEGSEKSLLINL
jgi:hypothetical protein